MLIQLKLSVTIPPNTTATVVLPTTYAESVLESGKPVPDSSEIKFIGKNPHSVSYAVGSGTFDFTARMQPQIVQTPLEHYEI